MGKCTPILQRLDNCSVISLLWSSLSSSVADVLLLFVGWEIQRPSSRISLSSLQNEIKTGWTPMNYWCICTSRPFRRVTVQCSFFHLISFLDFKRKWKNAKSQLRISMKLGNILSKTLNEYFLKPTSYMKLTVKNIFAVW